MFFSTTECIFKHSNVNMAYKYNKWDALPDFIKYENIHNKHEQLKSVYKTNTNVYDAHLSKLSTCHCQRTHYSVCLAAERLLSIYSTLVAQQDVCAFLNT